MRWLFVGFVALAACGRHSFDEVDARTDATGDGNGDPLSYITVAPGWSKAVFVDFSSDFVYNPNDFVDGAAGETILDNHPDAIAVLGAPFAEILAIGAGRSVIELSTTRYIAHDYGMHAQDTSAPDDFARMSLVPDAGGLGPRIAITSTSDGGGDGLFLINTAFSIARDVNLNNVRCFAWDEAGVVQGTPQVFVGTGSGMFRRSDTTTAIRPGDFRSILALPSALYFVREIAADDQRLVRATWTGTAFMEAELTVRETISFADGDRPAGALAWAVTDLEQLDEVALDGTMHAIASSDTPAYVWAGAAVPPIGHALAQTKRSIYVLESNRDLDLDRVLVFTQD